MSVLHCFKLLFRRLGKNLWAAESMGFPVEVFETLRQNPRFREYLWSTDPFAWFKEFMSLVRGHTAYGDVFSRVIDFLFERLPGSELHSPSLVGCGLQVRWLYSLC